MLINDLIRSDTRVRMGRWKDILSGLYIKGFCILVTSQSQLSIGVDSFLKEQLGEERVISISDISSNPDVDSLDVLVDSLAALKIDLIVAVGGGSVIDTAKVLSLFLNGHPGGRVRAFLEGQDSREIKNILPVIAIPTTAGTGSEVTPFATLWDMRNKQKYSLEFPGMVPDVAILDWTLTSSQPLELTLSTGLDALSHAFESIWNINSTEFSCRYSYEAIRLGLNALPLLIHNGDSESARSDMQIASWLAGSAIGMTKTALAHSVSYPLTIEYGIPHGLASGFAIPEILFFNSGIQCTSLSVLVSVLGFNTLDGMVEYVTDLWDSLPVGDSINMHLGNRILDVNKISVFAYSNMRSKNNVRAATLVEIAEILQSALARNRIPCA